MDLTYILVSLAGIAVLIGLSALLFGIPKASVQSEQNIETALAQDVPGFRAGDHVLAPDKSAALVENVSDGQIYLAVGCGDGIVTRKLTHGFVRGVARDGRDLRLTLDDFSLPLAHLVLGDEASARSWEMRLSGL